MMTIDVETLRTWLEEGRPVTILDVRPTAERAEWAIPGSFHVDAKGGSFLRRHWRGRRRGMLAMQFMAGHEGCVVADGSG